MLIQFGGRDNNKILLKDAKVVVLPVPYGRTVTYRKGTQNGPRAILEASNNLELFDEELKKEIYTIGINTSDLLKVNGLEPKEILNVVETNVLDIFKNNQMPVVLGGEHSLTIGAVSAAKKQYNDLSILYFDAHYDLKNSYKGSRYNHACAARRLVEMAPVVETGVRSLSKEENEFLIAKDIQAITMADIMKDDVWIDSVKDYLSKNVYISIDLDVFDPSIMPSVGNPEPGGIGWYEFLRAIRSIIAEKTIVGFDVVELCPIKDMAFADFMAARLIYKILGYIFFK